MTVSRTRWLLGAFGLGAAIGCLLAPPAAHADDLAFLTDVKAAGFYTDVGNGPLVAAGDEVCALLGEGNTPAQVAQIVFLHSGANSFSRAQTFVSIAQQDLCVASSVA